MKRNRSLETVTDLRKPMEAITLSDDKGNKLPVEANLSPERIMEGASAKTALLNHILAQQEEFHELRHWGINE